MAAEIVHTAYRMASSDLPPLQDSYTIFERWILGLVANSGEHGLAWTFRLLWAHQIAWMDAIKAARCAVKHV
jgi:hypothetical protein